MSIQKYKEFYLVFHLICVDYQQEENIHFLLGDVFNIEIDLMLFEVDQIILPCRIRQGCKNFIFIDFKKLSSVEKIRKIYNVILSVKKEQSKD